MHIPRFFKHIDILIAAIAGFYIIQLFTAYSGVGISPDSIMYASTAESIYKHGNLITFNGTPLVFFPVFYPAFLSLSFLFGVNAVQAGPVINGLLFAVTIFLCGWILNRIKPAYILYKWAILIIIILSPALLEIFTYLWSETLFILLIMLFVVTLKQYLDKPVLKWLLLSAIVAALCCLTRYAGLVVIATGGLLILINRALPFSKRITHTLTFGFAGVLPLAVNILINSLSTGLATGTRKPSVTSFSENLYYFGTVICDWLGLNETARPYGPALSVFIIIALIAGFVFLAIKGIINNYQIICAAFAIIYSLFILIIATVSRFEQLSSRLLSPMFIPMLIGCTFWVPTVLARIKSPQRVWVSIVTILIMSGFLYNYILIDLKRYDDEFEYGVPGYTDDDWNKSEFVSFLKKHTHQYKSGLPVYSDADEAVYFFTGMQAKLVPHRYFTDDVKKFSQNKHYYLIWFNAMANPELIGLDDIRKQHQLKKLYEFEDGVVYEVWGK
ncbi:hypothetical protein EOD41_01725 [Mucilaginibacter limnophilus]|uniref:Glycosyltransferase RgtA/B/C/D-like domain-containing protein n=1 Tax=Mucilaginibacter limnophilus TaxID=1932778 RepID=A0A437MYH3_9SPHI|nr:hypothetical protein [Mucilaginibacter limnophilus]RVU02683.1 hypothetical protein EOD41_01725 [Mucilaginibacter limnophilus]